MILPVVGSSRGSAETYLNAVSSKSRHNVRGTYVFGGRHDPPVVSHTGGRTYGQHTSEEASVERLVPAQLAPHRSRFVDRRPPVWLLSGLHSRLLARLRWVNALRQMRKRGRSSPVAVAPFI